MISQFWGTFLVFILGFGSSSEAHSVIPRKDFDLQLKTLKTWSKKIREQENSPAVDGLKMNSDPELAKILTQDPMKYATDLTETPLSPLELFEALHHYRIVSLASRAGDAIFNSENDQLDLMVSDQYSLYRMLGGKRSYSSYQTAHRDPKNKTYRYGSAYSWDELGYPAIARKEEQSVKLMISRYTADLMLADIKAQDPSWAKKIVKNLSDELTEAQKPRTSKDENLQDCVDQGGTKSQISKARDIAGKK